VVKTRASEKTIKMEKLNKPIFMRAIIPSAPHTHINYLN
jgi:hypothetical protein